LSLGPFNTDEQIDRAIRAVTEIASSQEVICH
jgi:cysteine sulfinate desulfinase/cysteine desulfurase-like protein